MADRHPLSQEFHSLLKTIGDLHDSKQDDYGRQEDPFFNVRASEAFGMPGWVGAMLRASDKVRRIEKAAQQAVKGEQIDLRNEGLEDSLLDLAVYALIAIVLKREEDAN